MTRLLDAHASGRREACPCESIVLCQGKFLNRAVTYCIAPGPLHTVNTLGPHVKVSRGPSRRPRHRSQVLADYRGRIDDVIC